MGERLGARPRRGGPSPSVTRLRPRAPEPWPRPGLDGDHDQFEPAHSLEDALLAGSPPSILHRSQLEVVEQAHFAFSLQIHAEFLRGGACGAQACQVPAEDGQGLAGEVAQVASAVVPGLEPDGDIGVADTLVGAEPFDGPCGLQPDTPPDRLLGAGKGRPIVDRRYGGASASSRSSAPNSRSRSRSARSSPRASTSTCAGCDSHARRVVRSRSSRALPGRHRAGPRAGRDRAGRPARPPPGARAAGGGAVAARKAPQRPTGGAGFVRGRVGPAPGAAP